MSNRAPQTEIVVFPTLHAEEMLLVTETNYGSRRRGVHKGANTKREDPCRLSWRLAPTAD